MNLNSHPSVGVLACWLGAALFGAEVPKAPVPPSPFLPVIYRYADAMIEHGRDIEGPQKTGLFFSALDRVNLAPLAGRPAAPAGLHEDERAGAKDGPLTGANPQHDENFLRLLYTLSDLSSRPKYREAADAELKWFLQNTASPDTHLLPWGVHLSWDAMKGESIAMDGAVDGTHEFLRPWLLWDRCFAVAPEASRQFALGLWQHQIADQTTGAFDSRAGFSRHRVQAGSNDPRHAGFFIRTWADAYSSTHDDRYLHAIDVLLRRFGSPRLTRTVIPSALSLAIDCDGASHRVPEPLSSRLRAFAATSDVFYCQFLNLRGTPDLHAPLWTPGLDYNTTARIGMMCVSRYENTGRIEYRALVEAAADVYLESLPAADEDAWPRTLGLAISLELAAWRSTARQVYLDRARALGNFALDKFFDQSPLPRASLKSSHYESITGADTLALALVELHLHILHITAVRCPSNTIDR